MVKKRVLAFGKFDGLHLGHLYYLEQAKKFGEELTVVIARDKRIQETKGKKPVLKEKERKKLVQTLKPVDKTVLGKETGNVFEILKKIKPEVIVLGYDQKPSNKKIQEEIKKMNLKAKVARIKAFNSKRFKSSKLKKEIIKRENC